MPITLVLLPGMDGTGDLFEPLLVAMGDSIQTIVVRYPPSKAVGYPGLAEIARASLPTDWPFIILGESFSGPIAVTLASESPKGLRGVILCASFISNPWPALAPLKGLLGFTPVKFVSRIFGGRFMMGRFKTPVLQSKMKNALNKVSPNVLQERARSVLMMDVSKELKAATVPFLYLQATEDSIVPKSAADTFTRLAVRGSVDSVEGPHLLLQCKPEEALKKITDFLYSL